jgi:hypothetical protein
MADLSQSSNKVNGASQDMSPDDTPIIEPRVSWPYALLSIAVLVAACITALTLSGSLSDEIPKKRTMGDSPIHDSIPFSVISAPNPRYSNGTMGIVLNSKPPSVPEAAALALYIRQQMMRNKKWSVLFIYVFADRATGVTFRRYQSQRKSAPLDTADFEALAAIWPKTLVRYEFKQGAEGYLIPSQNPNGWWRGRTIFRKVSVYNAIHQHRVHRPQRTIRPSSPAPEP